MSADYLKGFSNFGYFPVNENTETKYGVTAPRTKLEGAYSCSKADNKSGTDIPADDNPAWDTENEWSTTDLTVVLRQIELKALSALCGVEFKEGETFEEGSLDNAPIVALNFRGMKRSGGYRAFRYYCAQLQDYEFTLTTREQGGKVADVTLKFKCKTRRIDNKMRGTQDFATSEAAEAWLATIPTVPAASTAGN